MNWLQWLLPWEPSVTVVIITALAAALFLRGSRNLPFWRKFCFWLGLGSFYAALHTQFDYYSEHEFFMHRLQHSVLHHAAPFLLALSRPGAALMAGMPAWLAIKWRKLLALQRLQGVAHFTNNPAVAILLFCGLILLWLIPSVHFIAMIDWRWTLTMNWSMAINGLMFWNLTLNNYCLRPAHLSPAARILMMLAVIPPQIIIGALLFFAPHEFYPIYSMCGRAFGISPLADQQIGGLILWIHGGMMSVLGILVVGGKEWLFRKK